MIVSEIPAYLRYGWANCQVFLDGVGHQAYNDKTMVNTSTEGRHQGEIRMIPLSSLMIVNTPPSQVPVTGDGT